MRDFLNNKKEIFSKSINNDIYNTNYNLISDDLLVSIYMLSDSQKSNKKK